MDAGGRRDVEAGGEPGEITELEPPHVLAWTWGAERYRFELAARRRRDALVFTHVFDRARPGSQHAAGWETYLARLDAHLAGG